MKHIAAAVVIALAAFAAFAHSGGTGSGGCHYDQRTGIYHCH